MQRRRLVATTASVGAVILSTLALTGADTATAGSSSEYRHDHGRHGHVVHGRLNPLNNSGVTGNAKIKVEGRRLQVSYHARNLAAGLPHAAHIHFGEQARHECPTVRDDTNRDFRVNVAEGLPAYGPIVKSLTTRGDTSPASALAVGRFSTAPRGKINYKRQMTASRDVARAIRRGEGVIVVHGIDYNNNGVYDFSSAGASELNAKLPAEATDPASCAVLR